VTYSIYGSGVTQVGETSYLTTARNEHRNGTSHGVIVLHGHNGSSLQSTVATSGFGAHVQALADAGIMVLAIDAGGPVAWSSPAAMTAITSAYTWLTGAGGAHSGKVGLFGWSMGGLTALNWLKRNPSLVAGTWLWAPCSDLDWARPTAGYTPAYATGGVNGAWQTEIDAAFGSYAATAGYRVRDEYSTWTGKGPIRIAHANNDTTVPIGQSTAFIAGVADATVTQRVVTTGDHTGVMDQVPTSETVAFFSAAAW